MTEVKSFQHTLGSASPEVKTQNVTWMYPLRNQGGPPMSRIPCGGRDMWHATTDRHCHVSLVGVHLVTLHSPDIEDHIGIRRADAAISRLEMLLERSITRQPPESVARKG
jgi:hypothetical protein